MERTHNRGALNCGFTLVETIVALAVIAVLVAAVVPSVIRRMDRAAWTAETANLSNIADALTQSILRTKTIPSYTNLASAVANEMSLPISAISTNARRYARAFLVDPAFQIGTNVAGRSYTQTTNGTTKPGSARVMIVSSLARGLPTNITNGVPTTNEFKAIWNTAEGAKPTTWTTWQGTGDDLRIKKLNLEPLFYQLILVSHDGTQAKFSIDFSPAVNVPTNSALGWKSGNVYYLDGTAVDLYDANDPPNLQIRHLLKRNISFLFESSTWRGQIQGDQQSFSASGADFYNHALTFFSRPTNPWGGSQAHGASQFGVMIAMYTFMFDYTYWANECPLHFDHHGNNVGSVPEYVLLNNQGQNGGNVDQFSSALLTLPPPPPKK